MVKQPCFGFAKTITLSHREREVMCGLANSKTQEQIAAELHISRKTVKRYCANIRAKFGGATMVGAIAIAVQAKLIRVRVFRETS